MLIEKCQNVSKQRGFFFCVVGCERKIYVTSGTNTPSRFPAQDRGVMSVYACLNALGERAQRSKVVYLWTCGSPDHLRRWWPGAGGGFLITEYIDCRGSASSVGTRREGDMALSLLSVPLRPECLWVDSLFLVQRVVINAPPIRVAVNEPTLWSVQQTSLGFSRRCRVGKRRPLLLAILCTPTHACRATRCTPPPLSRAPVATVGEQIQLFSSTSANISTCDI